MIIYIEKKDLELMKNNNGVLESNQVAKTGIDNKTLQRLNEAGEIERFRRGIKDVYYSVRIQCYNFFQRRISLSNW